AVSLSFVLSFCMAGCLPPLLAPLCCFFSSRTRHTSSKRDWSSDVCSSDLLSAISWDVLLLNLSRLIRVSVNQGWPVLGVIYYLRSEERRVGKEYRTRGTPAN